MTVDHIESGRGPLKVSPTSKETPPASQTPCDYKDSNAWPCIVCYVAGCECYTISIKKLFEKWDLEIMRENK